jgi:hypothetical protein
MEDLKASVLTEFPSEDQEVKLRIQEDSNATSSDNSYTKWEVLGVATPLSKYETKVCLVWTEKLNRTTLLSCKAHLGFGQAVLLDRVP